MQLASKALALCPCKTTCFSSVLASHRPSYYLAGKRLSNLVSGFSSQHPGHAGNLRQHLHHTCQHPFHLCHIFLHQGRHTHTCTHVYNSTTVCPECSSFSFSFFLPLSLPGSYFQSQCKQFPRRLFSLAPTARWLEYSALSSSSSLPLSIW